MLATMEPPGQREQGVQNRMWELVNCRAVPGPGTQAILRVLQSAEPDRGWHLIEGRMASRAWSVYKEHGTSRPLGEFANREAGR